MSLNFHEIFRGGTGIPVIYSIKLALSGLSTKKPSLDLKN